MDLVGRPLVDAAIMLIVGHLFLQQAVAEPVWQDDFTTKPKSGNGNGTDNKNENLDSYRAWQNHKKVLAHRYINNNIAKIKMVHAQILRNDRSTITDYDTIVGPVPQI